METIKRDKGGIPSEKFPKTERLTSQKIIEELFSKGSSAYLYPFRLKMLGKSTENKALPQILITVPKKNFKRAVDRNRIRRQIREVYRKNKSILFSEKNVIMPLYLAIIYSAKEKIDYNELEKKLILIFSRFIKADT
ncbi:MAG: ribonuclease P protein component [Cytophagaceae bacterium]